jgi:site-specific recombinase XerD
MAWKACILYPATSCGRCGRSVRRENDAARFVFMTERGSPMSAAGFRKMLARTSHEAKFPFLVHPHMLRHVCGFKLANDGQDTRALQHYLGHKNIQHTVRYTELSRFKSFWD